MNQEKKSQNELFILRLSEMMTSLSLTQNELGVKAQVSQSAIHGYLKGLRAPGAAELSRLSLALDVTMDWLWGIADCTEKQDDALRENVELRAKLALITQALHTVLDKAEG